MRFRDSGFRVRGGDSGFRVFEFWIRGSGFQRSCFAAPGFGFGVCEVRCFVLDPDFWWFGVFHVRGSGFRVRFSGFALAFRIQDFMVPGFKGRGFRCRIGVSVFRIWVSGFSGSGFRGSGFRVRLRRPGMTAGADTTL